MEGGTLKESSAIAEQKKERRGGERGGVEGRGAKSERKEAHEMGKGKVHMGEKNRKRLWEKTIA